jgi:hypothetical protein
VTPPPSAPTPTFAQFCGFLRPSGVEGITKVRQGERADEVVFFLRSHPAGVVQLRFVFAKDGTFLGVNEAGDARVNQKGQ